MAEMKVQYVDIAKVKPYENNPRINDDAVGKVANSIKEFGWKQPIVVDSDYTIIVGHTRWKAAKQLKMDEVPVLVAEDLSPEKAKAYRLADNKTNEFAEWDMGLLDLELDGITGINMSDFGFTDDDDFLGGNKYDGKIATPVYEITGECPKLYELVDTQKTTELVQAIKEADIDDDVKEFLTYAAYRHLSFHYGKVAEYYAWASPEVQKLMEDSGLVIIDVNAAIENGFVKLTKRLQELMDNDE